MVQQKMGTATTDWAGKTYSEIQEIAKQNGSLLVVPVGSIEQHGHHLPTATDTILVDAIAHRGTEQVVDDVPILITPTIWSGFSPHHLPFGGTITLEFHHLIAIIEDIVESAVENGFDAVLLLNGHGGNASLIKSAVMTIGKKNNDTEILGLTYFQLAESFIDEIRESAPGGMSHGGEFETSLMLHLRPDLVREESIEGTKRERTYDQEGVDLMSGGILSVYKPFNEYSPSGAIGDPKLANAEKGKRIYERLGNELEALLRQMHQENA